MKLILKSMTLKTCFDQETIYTVQKYKDYARAQGSPGSLFKW